MHEYPITCEILRLAEEKAKGEGAVSVEEISLVVGEQSGFIGDSIKLYFDIIAEGSIAEGAEIKILPVNSKLNCRACGSVFERAPFSFACPECGGDGEPTDIGKEFYIKDIKIKL
jgi:hydrogenase nickel incorporation protein HypA/HybF